MQSLIIVSKELCTRISIPKCFINTIVYSFVKHYKSTPDNNSTMKQECVKIWTENIDPINQLPWRPLINKIVAVTVVCWIFWLIDSLLSTRNLEECNKILISAMNGVKKKNQRLCERLKHLNVLKVGQDVRSFEKEKRVKTKPKSKKGAQNTFSMITFYQSIPSKY